jgi:hypothetical protein
MCHFSPVEDHNSDKLEYTHKIVTVDELDRYILVVIEACSRSCYDFFYFFFESAIY